MAAKKQYFEKELKTKHHVARWHNEHEVYVVQKGLVSGAAGDRTIAQFHWQSEIVHCSENTFSTFEEFTDFLEMCNLIKQQFDI